jgi:hypothetical protein
MSTAKLGKDLKVGDVIDFWGFSKEGARIFKLWPYTGRYPAIVCANARLVGRAAMHDGQVTRETAIEAEMTYTVRME